jgi:membrane-anchored protein YejM (alkaline phosphatase superfamily)
MPTSRGFDYYLGVPFSVDMGNTVWRQQTAAGDNGVLPLVKGTATEGFSIVEQPAKLENLTARYVDAATGWIRQQADADNRFVLYVPFSHVHNPQFCSSKWCGSSTVIGGGPAVPTGHGGTGSAVQEMDAAVGAILDVVRVDPALDQETLTFFTSDNGAPSNHALDQTGPTLNATADGVGSNYPL